ncbi:MAG: hypothetical protein ACO3EZ_16730, partial [Prochlorotrichaceae cyanobacterium]
NDIDFTGASVKAGIGDIEAIPSDGAFKLVINGITSSAIPFNATAVCVYNAVSNNVSTVALYGGEDFGSYLLTASQPNTAMSFGADSFTLFPASSVLIGTRRFPASDVSAQQTVRLAKDPAVYSDTFVPTPTAGQIALTKTQDGGANANETYDLAVKDLVKGGLYSFNYGGNSSVGIDPFSSATGVQIALSAVTGIGENNISVQENGAGGYTIQFVGALGQTNITTNLVLDDSGISFIPYKQTTLTLNTAELDDLFAEAGESTISPTLEIELTQNGTPKTVYQGSVTVRKDLITVGATVPGNQAEYYTKAEADALFIQDSAGNINETNRELADSSSVDSIGWGARKLYDTTGSEVLRWDSGLGFFGASAITRPENTNVISALVNLGIISGTVTIGVTGGGGGTTTFPTVCLGGTAISVFDGVNFEIGTTTGSKFATATTQKISFYGSTPIVQPTATNVVSALQDLGLVSTSVTLGVADIANAVTDWSGNISATTRFLADTSTTISLDWENRVAKDTSAVTSIDWANRRLRDSTGVSSVNWASRQLNDTSATASILWGSRTGVDSSAVSSVDWQNRVLFDSTGTTAIDWQNGAFGTGATAVTIDDPNIEISSSYFIKHGSGDAFQILTASQTLDFGSIAGGGFNEVTMAVTGAAEFDTIQWGVPANTPTGIVFDARVSTAGVVALRAFNVDNKSHSPVTSTYRVVVLNFS